MPLPNRIDPFGNIFSTSARGAWMGNRGQLHGTGKHILRQFKTEAWITCLLQFKGWHRPLMAANQYTELFFMDEATAMAAGHRPCFECRRADYNRFKTSWIAGNPQYGFNEKTSIKEIDAITHSERIGQHGKKITFADEMGNLPNGTFIRLNNDPYLLWDGQVFRWTPFGYDKGNSLPASGAAEVLTPRSTVNALRAGYPVQASTHI